MPTPRRHESAAARQRAYRQRRKLSLLNLTSPKDLPASSHLRAIPSLRRWKALREQAQTALRTLRDEMQTYQDQRSEAWQESQKAERFQEAIEKLEETLEVLQDIELSRA